MWTYKIRIEEPATERSSLYKQLVEYKTQLGLNPDYQIEDVLIGKRQYDTNNWWDTIVHLGTNKLTIMTLQPIFQDNIRTIDRVLWEIPVSAFRSLSVKDSIDAIGNVDRNFRFMAKSPLLHHDNRDQRCDAIWLSCYQADLELSSIIARWADKIF